MSSAVALTTTPTVYNRNGTVYASSRDVAAFFGKQHAHVLRDIDALIWATAGSPNLDGLFVERSEYHDKARKEVRLFDMTRDGFTLLAMGFTGKTALAFKVRYIEEFNRMEAQLRAPAAPLLPDFTDPGEAAIAWGNEYKARKAVHTVDFTTRSGNATTTYRIRVVPLERNPWFIAADVCRAIGVYMSGGEPNSAMAVRILGPDEVRREPLNRIEGWTGKRFGGHVVLISESGLYKLIMRSDKPQARAFQAPLARLDWVTKEVLPTIRKTGGYVLRGADRAPWRGAYASYRWKEGPYLRSGRRSCPHPRDHR
ncbi:Rha family transcriptional regulator [Ancylobacter amanitiformis]|uniref:Rha family phage regulatory protein n=1 Tax=Ancylobacter amanitiformis TaxID=217069 RepID=A0ABU0LPJ1_9HYPH|nr:Rha family transcriptional regulator [Ancylobacter amanitiformis]MDQ0510621.1 Rha family phage regulatory protein [Ancylobacter amanitiformis]